MADEIEEGLPPLDLRVARVMEAREHPDADRLLVLLLDLGTEDRQVVAGLASSYELDDLKDRHVIVVANLKHARLRGEISQGMVLAAEDEEGRLGLLLAPEARPGDRLMTPSGAPTSSDGVPEITIDDFRRHTLEAREAGVKVDGEMVTEPRLQVDRGVTGPVR